MKALLNYIELSKYVLEDIIIDLEDNSINEGLRKIYVSKDGDKISMTDHANQRKMRSVEQGGDGEKIYDYEIKDIFRYCWKDIVEMNYEGSFTKDDNVKSFTVCSKAYLNGKKENVKYCGARPQSKYLWVAFMIKEVEHYRINIIIKTIYRGERLKHSKQQEKLEIDHKGKIRRINA